MHCRQSYMNMKLVVLGEDGTTAEIDTFKYSNILFYNQIKTSKIFRVYNTA